MPRTSNTILNKCYLTKVEVNSDNDITSTYTLDPTTGELTGTGTGKQIVLTTKGSGTYANGFPLTNNATSAATNGAYMVIKPGTHTLKIRYWVKDVATGVEGTITKTLSQETYATNTYYKMTANLDVKDYDGDHYYMWDAQEQYWKGFEWTRNLPAGVGQPTLSHDLPGATTSSNDPQSNTDSRWYNEGGASGRVDATRSCATLPNANEMTWYCKFGDPRWDEDELWTTMGHLYKGGVWLKKKSVLQAEGNYDSNTDVNGKDWRITADAVSIPLPHTLPSVTDAGNYFYLPALGAYYSGLGLDGVGIYGSYWSSSSAWKDIHYAYSLYFDEHQLLMGASGHRDAGQRVDGFE